MPNNNREHIMQTTFGRPRALIGMIHVEALPGSPLAKLGMQEIIEIAIKEARIYAESGFHAIMIENMHDRPYLPSPADPMTTTAMTMVGQAIKQRVDLPLGVQILAGANREAFAVAQAIGASFVRVEAFVFAHVTYGGLKQSCAAELLRYRKAIGAEDIRLFADIKKKHAAHALTADVDITQEAREAARFMADGVIVSGRETGVATDCEEVVAVAQAVDLPVLVGSGITLENIHQYTAADALIVGSSLKQQGLWSEPLEESRVIALNKKFTQSLMA